jgi:RNA polymerase sigma-32 factor
LKGFFSSVTDTPAISIPTENESSDTTALVSEPDSVCRKSAGGALVARGKNAGQIIVSDESGSKQLVPYQGTQGGSLVVRPAPVKGEVVPYEKKQYLPAVIPRLGDLDAYIRYANAAPILSAEEEHALAVRLRDEGDLMAAQQLILSHLRLVVSIARGFLGYGLPHADLIQEGNIGLMKAIKHFDPDRGVRLMTFSVHWIRSEIQEYIVRNWRMVKLATTKNQRKLFFNLRQMKADEKSLSTSETERIAETLDVKPEEVREMEARLSGGDTPLESPGSTDAEDDNAFAPIDWLSREEDEPEAALEERDRNRLTGEILRNALDALDERSRLVVQARWLRTDNDGNPDPMTLQELASKLGVSAERVRQIEKKAIAKLRSELAADKDIL